MSGRGPGDRPGRRGPNFQEQNRTEQGRDPLLRARSLVTCLVFLNTRRYSRSHARRADRCGSLRLYCLFRNAEASMHRTQKKRRRRRCVKPQESTFALRAGPRAFVGLRAVRRRRRCVGAHSSWSAM